MSRGYFGHMKLMLKDETYLLYTYNCFNVNNDDWENMKEKEDGEIVIRISSLIEPDVYEKRIKTPGGRKKTIMKRVPREVDLAALFNDKNVVVNSASGTWRTTIDGIDVIAYRMIRKLYALP